MRKNAVLIAGLLLVTGLAGVDRARAAAGQTPWLGVYLQELTPELREAMDYRGADGVILTSVVADGPAANAGLRQGDVVVRFNSREVDSPAKLQELVGATRVGRSVSVEVFRAGERHVLSVRPAARPPEAKVLVEAPDAPEPPSVHVLPSPDGQRRV